MQHLHILITFEINKRYLLLFFFVSSLGNIYKT
jgi:hypothetical protein